MKKLFVIWALVAFVLPCTAATLEASTHGQYRVSTDESWTKVLVHVDDDAAQYPSEVIRAYTHKDTVVPVKEHSVSRRDGLFHTVSAKITDVGIIYDGKSISVVHDVVGTPETSFNPFAIFWLTSVLLMAFGVLKARESKNAFDAFATTAVLAAVSATLAFAAVSATLAFATTAVLAAVSATLAFATAAVAITYVGNKKAFYIFAGVYGIAMAVSMGAFLLS